MIINLSKVDATSFRPSKLNWTHKTSFFIIEIAENPQHRAGFHDKKIDCLVLEPLAIVHPTGLKATDQTRSLLPDMRPSYQAI